MDQNDCSEHRLRDGQASGTLDEVRAFSRRGLFLGGCPKSGTTLILSLLDGHPKLVVLPEETRFLDDHADYSALGNYQDKLRRLLEKTDLRFLGQTAQAKTTDAPSADVRDYRGFDRERFVRLASLSAGQPWMNDSLLFSETIRAYAITAGHDWRDCVRWVEKSTGTETSADTLFELFPDAKLLQVVRDPRAVFVSRKKRLLTRYGRYAKAHRLVRLWNRSSRHILKLLERRDSYLAIRYEDLVQAPRESLERICQFVGIELLPELFVPTRASRQWQGNSSFDAAFGNISAESVDRWKGQLSEDEIWWIEFHCREGMRIAGYPLQTDGRFALSRWLKRLPGESWGGYLRARRASLCQLAGLLADCRYPAVPAGAPAALLPGTLGRATNSQPASPG